MEKLTSLNLDFNKVLIHLLIPGFTAFSPWLAYIIFYYYYQIEYIINNVSLLITLIAIISLIIGLLIESLGSRVEVWYYDKKNKVDIKVWEKYLTLNFANSDPVGQRYIRNILLHMKFEVSFGISLFFMSFGLIYLNYNINLFDSYFIFSIPFCLSLYLILFEGLTSSKILDNTRKLLVAKYYNEEPPQSQTEHPATPKTPEEQK